MKTKKPRIVFFAIALIYNLLLGLYLKDFIVLSQTLTAFYLLSVLPTFFLLIEARSRAMRTTVSIKNPYEQLKESKQLEFVCSAAERFYNSLRPFLYPNINDLQLWARAVNTYPKSNRLFNSNLKNQVAVKLSEIFVNRSTVF